MNSPMVQTTINIDNVPSLDIDDLPAELECWSLEDFKDFLDGYGTLKGDIVEWKE